MIRGLKMTGLWLLLISTQTLYAQDLTLWYNKPAQKWVEALPIGNGRLGAMVFGGAKQDRIQFNEETLWTGYPRDYNKKGAWQYLDTIRNLLFAGKQAAAESIAGQQFMGLKSNEGNREAWVAGIKKILQQKNNPSLPGYNDASWKKIRVPNYDGWESEGHEGLDGAVCFTTSFDLPDSWHGSDLKLDLNRITDEDYTYVNGRLAGTQNNADPRVYTIPASVLKKGKNTIAILVLNYSGKGGILGYKDTARHIGIYPTDASAADLISLNGRWKYFIQDDEPPAAGQYQASYQPFGDLYLNFNLDESKISHYRRSLDLGNAMATTSYTYDGVQFKREYLASAPAQVIAVRLTANRENSISFEMTLSSPHKNFSVEKFGDEVLKLGVKVRDGVLKGTALVNCSTEGGERSISGNKLTIRNANAVTLYLYAHTNFNGYDQPVKVNEAESRAVSAMARNAGKAYTAIQSAHIKEYQRYFNTLSVSFANTSGSKTHLLVKKYNGPDPSLLPTDERLARFASSDDPSFVALYLQYGRYLLISSSRPGTRPANLQGIWNDQLNPPWGSKYTTNINLEMNYWPAELLNLSPMHQSLFQMIRELSVSGRETAHEYYRAPGWVLHHNTDLWRGTAPINASNHGIWVTGGAWLCDHLWEHFAYTRDLKFLRDTAYPIMKQADLFFNTYLVKDPRTVWLISTPSNSPEQGGLVAGPTMDHQIIRALFKNTIAAAEILNEDADLRSELKEKYVRIAPNQIGKYGQLQEWVQDVDDTTNKHRHVSHLWGVYPGNEINWEASPELMRAAKQSLIYRGDAATGWSLGWKINLWARFKDGEHTYKMIQMLLSPAVGGAGSYPNLFDAHPPFQIDGNFGGAAGIGELLLQSHTQYINILPALPSALPSGDIRGIRARGNFTLDIKWEKGKLQQLRVVSLTGGDCLLRYNGKILKLATSRNGTYTFNGSLDLQKQR